MILSLAMFYRNYYVKFYQITLSFNFTSVFNQNKKGNNALKPNIIFYMKLNLIRRENPINRGSAKYYPHVVNEGVAELKDLAKQITKYSSLSSGDVTSTLENMVDAATIFLLMGKGVRLGRLGMLRVSVESDGSNTPGEFHTQQIRRVKLIFTPSVEFKKELEDVSFEVIRENSQSII